MRFLFSATVLLTEGYLFLFFPSCKVQKSNTTCPHRRGSRTWSESVEFPVERKGEREREKREIIYTSNGTNKSNINHRTQSYNFALKKQETDEEKCALSITWKEYQAVNHVK